MAICNNQNIVLEWLLRLGCPTDGDNILVAVRNGNVVALQILHAAHCKFHKDHFLTVIKNKQNIDIFRFLRQANCPWDKDIIAAIIEWSDMDIFRWLRTEGCPFHAYVFTTAIKKGDMQIVRWLYEEQCPFSAETFKILMEKYLLVGN